MKVAFIDTALDGHHLSYMQSLVECVEESIVIVPQKTDSIVCRQYEVDCSFHMSKKFGEYMKWIREISDILGKEKPDIIHFLYGDALFRFFGIGLGGFNKIGNTITIFHHVRRSKSRDISNRKIAQKMDRVVVHTDSLMGTLEEIGISNGVHIEYPQFSNTKLIEQNKALKSLGIDKYEGKILLALGGTREDKGIDLLLEALNGIDEPFHLLIAGKEGFFTKEFIEEHSRTYADKVTMKLKFLDDEEFSLCLNAADIVVLPYRKIFDGASGPLGEGVAVGKMIIGPSHGSIGDLIRTYHLGLTFESENVDSLRESIQTALRTDWLRDDEYLKYQEILSTGRFQREYRELYESLVQRG